MHNNFTTYHNLEELASSQSIYLPGMLMSDQILCWTLNQKGGHSVT